MVDDKGQLHTIEAFTALFLMVLVVMYSLNAVTVTPTSASTSSQSIEGNNEKLAQSFLEASIDKGTLKEAILRWNSTSRKWNGTMTDRRYYTGNLYPVEGEFGNQTEWIFTENGIVHNIYLSCDGNTYTYLDNGNPSDHSSTASVHLVLKDYDTVYTGEQLEDINFVCPNEYPSSSIHSIVEVRIVLWRM